MYVLNESSPSVDKQQTYLVFHRTEFQVLYLITSLITHLILIRRSLLPLPFKLFVFSANKVEKTFFACQSTHIWNVNHFRTTQMFVICKNLPLLAWFSMSHCQWKPGFRGISTYTFWDPKRALRPFLVMPNIYSVNFISFFFTKIKNDLFSAIPTEIGQS